MSIDLNESELSKSMIDVLEKMEEDEIELSSKEASSSKDPVSGTSGEKVEYQCDKCERKFPSKQGRSSHQKLHTNKRHRDDDS